MISESSSREPDVRKRNNALNSVVKKYMINVNLGQTKLPGSFSEKGITWECFTSLFPSWNWSREVFLCILFFWYYNIAYLWWLCCVNIRQVVKNLFSSDPKQNSKYDSFIQTLQVFHEAKLLIYLISVFGKDCNVHSKGKNYFSVILNNKHVSCYFFGKQLNISLFTGVNVFHDYARFNFVIFLEQA